MAQTFTYVDDSLAVWCIFSIDDHDRFFNVTQNEIHMAIVSLAASRSQYEPLENTDMVTYMQNAANLPISTQFDENALAER